MSQPYRHIVPCGIEGHGVTSLVDLGLPVEMGDLDVALKRTFEDAVGQADGRHPVVVAAHRTLLRDSG